MRITNHPVLGESVQPNVTITVDGVEIQAIEGEMIAAALTAAGIKTFRHTHKNNEPRGIFCGIGRCTDCTMTVNGAPNVRTCVRPVEDKMVIESQKGLGVL